MSEIALSIHFKTVECCRCHVVFAMPRWLYEERTKDHLWFYCPNGHQQHFTELSDEDMLRRQLEQARQAADAVREQRSTLEKRLRAQKAATTRIKNRVGRGVCPCCNRSFRDLADHMAVKHPEYVDAP